MLPLAIPAVMGILRLAATQGVKKAVQRHGQQAYNAALGIAKDKGAKGQQVRKQLQSLAEKSDKAAKNIPKPIRDMMLPKGTKKAPPTKEAPIKAERNASVTPKKEPTKARVAERKERMAKGAERKATQPKKTTGTRGRAGAIATGVTLAGTASEAKAPVAKKKAETKTPSSTKPTAPRTSSKDQTARSDRSLLNKAKAYQKTGEAKYKHGKSAGGVSFGEAFKYWKGKGNKTFTWNGKKYTTETK